MAAAPKIAASGRTRGAEATTTRATREVPLATPRRKKTDKPARPKEPAERGARAGRAGLSARSGRERRPPPTPRIPRPSRPTELAAKLLDGLPPGQLAPPLSERHREVLLQALRLFGERGYAGASLRELARRLRMQQPSLYHYFDTKPELVEQIITHLGSEMLMTLPPRELPARLVDVPRFVVDLVSAVYENPEYPGFVRFLFAVSTEQPQYRAAIQTLYGQGLELGSKVLMAGFVAAGEIGEAEAKSVVRTATNAVGLALIEEFVLYGRRTPSAELRSYADDVVRLLEDALRLRAQRRA